MSDDPEIKAMSQVLNALAGLPDGAVERVLRWAAARFDLDIAREADGPSAEEAERDSDQPPDSERTFEEFAELFDAASPTSAVDNALVAGYWFQVVKSNPDFDGFSLNKELKHLGHPSSNITRDLDALIKRTPRLVMQIRKSGNTRQARKRYKLTTEGVRTVARMIADRSAS